MTESTNGTCNSLHFSTPCTWMPPEWYPHEATWLAWPRNSETWANLEPVRLIWLKMIETLLPHEKVCLLVDSEEVKRSIEEKTCSLNNRENLSIFVTPYNDSWIRDYGPNFVFSKELGQEQLCVQDFIFNAWGGKYEPWDDDNSTPLKVSKWIGKPALSRGLVLEGGSIDVNGNGFVLTTKQCLLNINRNPNLTQSDIEECLSEYLGVSQVLWLGDGIEGDDTDGHIDDITRFVSEDTIVTVVEKDASDANYQPLQRNLQTLKTFKNLQGKPFNIIELPTPRKWQCSFGRAPASYANFYIANGVVLVPIFSCPQDDVALEILQGQFTDRKVVGIECSALVEGLGGIHCVTQQQPVSTRLTV